MAENDWPADGAAVLGVSMDGTGYGPDGTVWGGEFLLCGYAGFERVGALRPVALPGGEAAVREPWRNLVAQLTAAFGAETVAKNFDRLGLSARISAKPFDAIAALIRSGFNTPLTSSAGRLFDAVAAAIGCSFDRISFEGQAAMEAESLARREAACAQAYPFGRIERDGVTLLDPAPMWAELLDDRARGVAPSQIGARFHTGFAKAASQLAIELARSSGAAAIALSGGVMQNGLLLQLMLRELDDCGLPVLTQREVPSNDGGLAFGQAAIAAAQVSG
jgi:hydrogenase maturation protein HypF